MRSMTGFGCATVTGEKGTFTVEIKAVNSRFLELNTKAFHVSPGLEDGVKQLIKNRVHRGKLCVMLSFEPSENGQEFHVSTNRKLLASYIAALQDVHHMDGVKNNKVTLSDLLSLPEPFLQVGTEAIDDEELKPLAQEATLMALEKLNDMRLREGQNLKADLENRLQFLHKKWEFLSSRQEAVVRAYEERLRSRMEELLSTLHVSVDEGRFLEEVAIYSEKTDFTEELVRFESHLKQFEESLQSTEPVGRRLDFLLQEINREINTTASKANDMDVIDCVIIVKTELEKIREQVQNIE